MKKRNFLFKQKLKYIVTALIAHVKQLPAFVASRATRCRARLRHMRLRRAVATGQLTTSVKILEQAGHHDPLVQQFIIGLCQQQGGGSDA